MLAGNVLTAVAGFLLAAAGQVDWWLFIAMLGGMTLIVASACVVNNYLDRDIDAVMKRTQTRPSVAGNIPGWQMVLFGAVLGVASVAILALYTNLLTLIIALIGFVTYVWLYGAWSKRRSVHGTLVGSISGAMPIAAGYAAVGGVVDAGLVVVFLIMFFWQFPEFYAISIYRRAEYAAAKIPLMSVVYGVKSTIRQIFVYTILYVLATIALVPLGYTGNFYGFIMAAAGVYWIYLAWLGLSASSPVKWSRRMFRTSMWMILLLCLMLAIGPLLP